MRFHRGIDLRLLFSPQGIITVITGVLAAPSWPRTSNASSSGAATASASTSASRRAEETACTCGGGAAAKPVGFDARFDGGAELDALALRLGEAEGAGVEGAGIASSSSSFAGWGGEVLVMARDV